MTSSEADTKKKSVTEALLNSLGGYPIGYTIGIVILPVTVGWIQKDPLTVNLLITAVYAAVSFLRSYCLRRFFAKYGIEDNIAVLAVRSAKKLRAGFYFRAENSEVLKKFDSLALFGQVRPAK